MSPTKPLDAAELVLEPQLGVQPAQDPVPVLVVRDRAVQLRYQAGHKYRFAFGVEAESRSEAVLCQPWSGFVEFELHRLDGRGGKVHGALAVGRGRSNAGGQVGAAGSLQGTTVPVQSVYPGHTDPSALFLVEVDFAKLAPPPQGTQDRYKIVAYGGRSGAGSSPLTFVKHGERRREGEAQVVLTIVAGDQLQGLVGIDGLRTAEPWYPSRSFRKDNGRRVVDCLEAKVRTGGSSDEPNVATLRFFQSGSATQAFHWRLCLQEARVDAVQVSGQRRGRKDLDSAVVLSAKGTKGRNLFPMEWTRPDGTVKRVLIGDADIFRPQSGQTELKIDFMLREVERLRAHAVNLELVLPFEWADDETKAKQRGELRFRMPLTQDDIVLSIDLGTSAVAAALRYRETDPEGSAAHQDPRPVTRLLHLDRVAQKWALTWKLMSEQTQDVVWRHQPEGPGANGGGPDLAWFAWSAVCKADGLPHGWAYRWPTVYYQDVLTQAQGAASGVEGFPKLHFYCLRDGQQSTKFERLSEQVVSDMVQQVVVAVKQAARRLLASASSSTSGSGDWFKEQLAAARIVLTYPNTFGQPQLSKLEDLVQAQFPKAGISLISESDAVGMLFVQSDSGRRVGANTAWKSLKKGQRLLIYDAGAGTLDVSYLEYKGRGHFRLLFRAGRQGCGNAITERLAFALHESLSSRRALSESGLPVEYLRPLVRDENSGEDILERHRQDIRRLWTDLNQWKAELEAEEVVDGRGYVELMLSAALDGQIFHLPDSPGAPAALAPPGGSPAAGASAPALPSPGPAAGPAPAPGPAPTSGPAPSPGSRVAPSLPVLAGPADPASGAAAAQVSGSSPAPRREEYTLGGGGGPELATAGGGLPPVSGGRSFQPPPVGGAARAASLPPATLDDRVRIQVPRKLVYKHLHDLLGDLSDGFVERFKGAVEALYGPGSFRVDCVTFSGRTSQFINLEERVLGAVTKRATNKSPPPVEITAPRPKKMDAGKFLKALIALGAAEARIGSGVRGGHRFPMLGGFGLLWKDLRGLWCYRELARMAPDKPVPEPSVQDMCLGLRRSQVEEGPYLVWDQLMALASAEPAQLQEHVQARREGKGAAVWVRLIDIPDVSPYWSGDSDDAPDDWTMELRLRFNPGAADAIVLEESHIVGGAQHANSVPRKARGTESVSFRRLLWPFGHNPFLSP